MATLFGSAAATTNFTNTGVWTLTNAPQGLSWGPVAVSDNGQFSVVSAYEGSVYLATDFGVHWTAMKNVPEELVIQSIACSGTCEEIWLLVSQEQFNSLFYSPNYGYSWNNYSAALPASQQWYDISASSDGQYVCAVGADLEVYISNDHGSVESWSTVQTAPSNMKNYAVSVSETGEFMAIGTVDNGGGIWSSADYGLTWVTADNLTPKDYFFSVALSRDGSVTYGLDTTEPGAIFRGTSTEPISILPNAPQLLFSSITTDKTGQYVVVSYSGISYEGYQYASVDYGETWNATLLYEGAPDTPLGELQFYHIASSGAGALVLGTMFDHGVYAYSPGCEPGSGHVGFDADGNNLCSKCSAGHYTAALYSMNASDTSGTIMGYADSCTACSLGTYSPHTGSIGESSCSSCPSMLSTTGDGCGECLAVYLDVPTLIQIAVFFALGLWLVAVLVRWSWRTQQSDEKLSKNSTKTSSNDEIRSNANNITERIAIFLVLVFPLMDTCTNLAYIMSARFYSFALFALTLASFLHPVPMFIHTVYHHGASPHIVYCTWWLGATSSAAEREKARLGGSASGCGKGDKLLAASPTAEKCQENTAKNATASANDADSGDLVPYPTFTWGNGPSKRFALMFAFDAHDSVYALVWEGVTWVVAILAQFATVLLMPVLVLVWLALGSIAQMTKTICISPVWNLWFRVWTTTACFDDVAAGGVDTKYLNTMLLAQLLLETLPSLVLQSVNNSLLGLWSSSPVAILSFVMSCVMLTNVIYKYLYHSVIVPTPADMRHIPIDRSIRVKIAPLDLDWGILDAKLPPYAMQLRYRVTGQTSAAAISAASASKGVSSGMYDPLLAADEEDAKAAALSAQEQEGVDAAMAEGTETGEILGGDGSGGAGLDPNQVI